MIRDLVLPMAGTSGDENALTMAIALAEDRGAHLCVIEPVNLPVSMANAWGVAPEMAMASVYSKLREQGEINAARVRGRLQRERISWEVRIVESFAVEPPRNVAMHARFADMGILSSAFGQDETEAARIGAYFNGLLFESGRPVLVIPPRCSLQVPVSKAAIAWRPTREATRALHDALPLLAGATEVELVMVESDVGEKRHGEQPGADIASHLARHGIQVDIAILPEGKQTTAATLLGHVAESGAQLLVAGGYGHTRLREWAIGGTTRDLLHASGVPVLFSH